MGERVGNMQVCVIEFDCKYVNGVRYITDEYERTPISQLKDGKKVHIHTQAS